MKLVMLELRCRKRTKASQYPIEVRVKPVNHRASLRKIIWFKGLNYILQSQRYFHHRFLVQMKKIKLLFNTMNNLILEIHNKCFLLRIIDKFLILI